MENLSKREEFLFWLIKHSEKWWLWLLVIIAASILVNTGSGLLAGLGLILVGGLSYAAGVNTALEATLGDDYTKKVRWTKKRQSKGKVK